MEELQKRKRKAKGIADVVFCIDASGSMDSCIDAVKDHIKSFIDGLQSNPNYQFDYRLGIVAHDSYQFDILDFTKDEEVFKNAVSKIDTRGDEYTLPAIDWGVDFNWRKRANRIVVVFTDEPLSGGHKPEFQKQKMGELFDKIIEQKVMLFFVGPECPEYRKFYKLPKSFYKECEMEDFNESDYKHLLEMIGKTASDTVSAFYQMLDEKDIEYNKDIYNIIGSILINRL